MVQYVAVAVKSPLKVLLVVLLRCSICMVGISNVWLLLVDQQNFFGHYGIHKASTSSAFDVVMMVNVLLIAGGVMNWCVLSAVWIFVYSFVLIAASLDYVVNGYGPWIPGLSMTVSRILGAKLGVGDEFAWVLALGVALLDFFVVFFAFVFTTMNDLKPIRSSLGVVPALTPALAIGQAEIGSSTPTPSLDENPLPTYAELNQPPPKYEDVNPASATATVTAEGAADSVSLVNEIPAKKEMND